MSDLAHRPKVSHETAIRVGQWMPTEPLLLDELLVRLQVLRDKHGNMPVVAYTPLGSDLGYVCKVSKETVDCVSHDEYSETPEPFDTIYLNFLSEL
jgi:hypothetical protein